jgi:hypothetical protein
MAVLEYFPKERKTFLLDSFDRIAPSAERPAGAVTTAGDQALLELLAELREDHRTLLGVNVPLELPPAITGSPRERIPPAAQRAMQWMRKLAARGAPEYTTYTQRPVELWIRHHVLPRLPESHRFEIDEALGGTKAPLTARMHFIRRQLATTPALRMPVVEAWPKLTVSLLAQQMNLPRRVVQSYRRLEEGAQAREQILEAMAERLGIFIYERDVRKLSLGLAAFDAFVCAYTALLCDQKRCEAPPKGFPIASGWVHFPHA